MSSKLPEFDLSEDERATKGALEQKHGCKFYVLKAEDKVVYCREPTPAAMECYMDEQLDDELRGKAAVNLFKACWEEPSKPAERAAMFATRPGVLIALALSFLKIAGIRAEVLQGK